jgi:GT2 family glycosyltransferase
MSRVSHYPLVSIIVLNYNGAHLLREELPSLIYQDYPTTEVIVVDNGSQDDSAMVAQSYGVRFLALGQNLYFGAGNNKGAEIARGEFLYFINNDMRFPSNVVSQLSTVMTSDDSIFALDIKQYNWEGSRMVRGATRMRPGGFIKNDVPGLHFDVSTNSEGPIDVPYASGASLFCRRSMFESLGGFDNTFYFDKEDLDLCWRAWLRGWRTVYLPHIHCFHKVGASFAEASPKTPARPALTKLSIFRRTSRAKNTLRFCIKTMSWTMVLLSAIRQAVLVIGFIGVGQWHRGKVFPHAWRGILDEWREIMHLRKDLRCHRVTNSQQLIRKFLRMHGHSTGSQHSQNPALNHTSNVNI